MTNFWSRSMASPGLWQAELLPLIFGQTAYRIDLKLGGFMGLSRHNQLLIMLCLTQAVSGPAIYQAVLWASLDEVL